MFALKVESKIEKCENHSRNSVGICCEGVKEEDQCR